ncbi:MAG: serine/threonine protein kinase [Deltaproteobacteria bacterium]|nr:serine/threonine protein kinase [Deltaproteobacteria bacterium]
MLANTPNTSPILEDFSVTSEPCLRVGAYLLIEPIGAGANSSVFRSIGPDGRTVAVKLLASRENDAQDRRFEREISVFTKLQHPNLLKLYDSGIDRHWGPYIVTELIEGQTLRQFTSENELCPEAVIILLAPLLSGLCALHQQGFVHRDLKPENVMVTKDGQLVIVDFGLALDADQSRLTTEGTIVGSVPYMSPEQIEGQTVTAQSDLWSLAVMAYEWVTGQRPFQRELQGEEVAAILNARTKPLGKMDRRVSTEFSNLIEECLHSNPDQRPADACRMLARLTTCVSWKKNIDLQLELRKLLSHPKEYVRSLNNRQSNHFKQAALEAMQAGDSFLAIELIDQALAYCPDDEDIGSLICRAASLEADDPVDKQLSPETVRQARRSIIPMIMGLVLCCLVSIWLLFAPKDMQPADDVFTGKPAAVETVTLTGNKEIIEGIGRLANGLKDGMTVQAERARQKAFAEGTVRSPKLNEADAVAIDLAGNFAELIIEAGVASLTTDSDEENIVISRNGQKAAVKLVGNMVRLFEIGLEE